MTLRKAIVLLVLAIMVVGLVACNQGAFLAEIQKMTPWNPNSSYAKGDFSLESNQVYQSLADNNANHEPAISPTWWTPSQ